MCRLFGLVANKEVDVCFSMHESNNSFEDMGQRNPDGWGIGWYDKSGPHIEKYAEDASDSERFRSISKEVKSKIFIAHVRKASCGNISDENSHPFQYDKWIFAHNGTVVRDKIMSRLISPYNKNFTSQPIDSEVYFRFILQCIDKEGNDVERGIRKAVQEIIDNGIVSSGANFILSDGKNLYGFRYGNSQNYSLYYLERNPGKVFQSQSGETKALIDVKKLADEKAVIIASEKMTSDEDWEPLKNGELLIITENLKISKKNIVLIDKILKAFMKAKWPKNIDDLIKGNMSVENLFNRDYLTKYLKILFSSSNPKIWKKGITIDNKTLKKKLDEKNSSILLFGYNGGPDDAYCELCIEESLIDFLVECKVIKNDSSGNSGRFNIQNSLSQSVGYLSNYTVDFLVLLIFDTCESSEKIKKEINKDWDITTPECRFIHTITNEYGNLCVVRIREKKTLSNSQNNTSENSNEQKSEMLNNSESNAQNNVNNNLPQNGETQLKLVPSIVEIFYHNAYFYRENNGEC